MKHLGFTQYTLLFALTCLAYGCSPSLKGTTTGPAGSSLNSPTSNTSEPSDWTFIHYDAIGSAAAAIQSTSSFQVSHISVAPVTLRTVSATSSFSVRGGVDAQP